MRGLFRDHFVAMLRDHRRDVALDHAAPRIEGHLLIV
jgi:hypothetical protein